MADPSIHIYLSQRRTFDTGYWYDYNDGVPPGRNGFILLPYKNRQWTQDKIWFPTMDELRDFCKACKCDSIKHAGDD